jgi:hypothetical protein
VENANIRVSDIQKKLDDLYSRKLTWKERFDGKLFERIGLKRRYL